MRMKLSMRAREDSQMGIRSEENMGDPVEGIM